MTGLRCFGTVLLVSLALALPVSATLIDYQGRITDDSGSPVADGEHTLSFALYADSLYGYALWQETASVSTQAGLFAHRLGSTVALPDSLFVASGRLFLEMTVEGTVFPRTRLAEVPFATAARGLAVDNSEGEPAIRTDGSERRLSILDSEGSARIELRADTSGDAAVLLPDSSVSSFEFLDEPGLTRGINISPVTLVTMEMTDLAIVEIETPAEGYIVVDGKCYVELSGSTGSNIALVQIDKDEGGGSQFPYYSLAGLGGYVNTQPCYFPVFVRRIYYDTAGIYEFRLEGRANDPTPALARTWDHVITATYYPTGYGVISEAVSDPGPFPEATPLDVRDPLNPDDPNQYYEVDLRTLDQRRAADKTAR